MNLGFLIKEDFLYVLLILDFTDLDIYITFIRVQNLSSIYQSRKVDTRTLILRKIQNPTKFKLSLRCRPDSDTKLLPTIMKNYLAHYLNVTELEAKIPLFRKMSNFIKFGRIDGFFPNLIPNVLKH